MFYKNLNFRNLLTLKLSSLRYALYLLAIVRKRLVMFETFTSIFVLVQIKLKVLTCNNAIWRLVLS
jgi:hypothetical protein